jgi:hypothetical protein
MRTKIVQFFFKKNSGIFAGLFDAFVFYFMFDDQFLN